MPRTFEELTSSAETTTWIPADVYANVILDGVVCYGQLSGVVTALEYDHTKGGGDIIQVRYISPRTASCASVDSNLGCQCLSAVSSSFGTYPIQVEAWGDYDQVCGWTIWETEGNIVEMILKEMAKRLAKCRDAQIWSNLVTAGTGAPNITLSSFCSCSDGVISGSCCTYTYNLYNSIISVQKHMQGDAYEPDYVVMHPDVAAFLYFRDGAYTYAQLPQMKYDGKGQLISISGMKVIECCNANMCNNAGGRVMAVVLDSKRAVGEVWGKKPTFEVDRQPECDLYKHVLWQYWGSHSLDPLAVGWVVNP